MLSFPDLRSRRFTPFHGLIIFGVLVVALVLGVSRLVRGEPVPTSDVPAVGWDEQEAAPSNSLGHSPIDRSTGEAPMAGGESLGNNSAQGTEGTRDTEVVDEHEEQENSVSSPVMGRYGGAEVPSSFNLALPFTSQAPTGEWDAVHEETCEEASIFMVAAYFDGTPAGKMDVATSDKAMLDLVAYQEANGYGVSVSAAELKAIIDDYYDGAYDVEIIDGPSVDDLKALLADGLPVIVPAAGRMLGNPFFTGEGPLYHMLVLRGYDDGRFVTNDPGTRHGENYTYDEDVFMNAIHDWNNGDPVNGARRVVVMKPAK